MLEFIQTLKQRYQLVISFLTEHDPKRYEYQQCIEQLIYAEAFIKKGQLLENNSNTPLQIAVIGPTQAGKSSLANVLLGSEMAGVSPLAGYTVHPHGFCHRTQINECSGLQNYFGRFQQLAPQQLTSDRYDCYSLVEMTGDSPLLPACILWDTPDFDSIDAADYKEGVIRTIALADIVVLVVSKEKYADQSVWDMMETIEAFNQPTLVCLNKLNKDNENLVVPSLQEKWLQVRSDEVPDVVPLYFQKHEGAPQWPENYQQAIFRLQKQVNHNRQPLYQQQFLTHFWDSWLKPVQDELEAAEQWRILVDESVEQALKEYQRDYLNHPHYYDTFQEALVELLNLLEIPGFSKILGTTRRVITWPVRKLMTLGKRTSTDGVAHEVSLLNQLGNHVLVQISEQILEKTDVGQVNAMWWKDAASVLRQQKGKILHRFQQEAENYHHDFQQDVDETAQKLYQKLQEEPVLLNSLRAARATTDATALAVAIYTGGIGLHDLVLTPAMLSVTSLLTESAAGSFMTRQEMALKKHQLETVKTRLFENQLKHALYVIPQQLPSDKRFNISRQQLQQAEKELNEKRNGLRLF